MLSAKSRCKIAVSGTAVALGAISVDTLEKNPIIMKNDNTLPTITANNAAKKILPNDVFVAFAGAFFTTRFAAGATGAASAFDSAGAASAFGSAGVASATGALSTLGSASGVVFSAAFCSATFCSAGVGSMF